MCIDTNSQVYINIQHIVRLDESAQQRGRGLKAIRNILNIQQHVVRLGDIVKQDDSAQRRGILKIEQQHL